MYQNAVANSCTTRELELPTKAKKSDHFVPALDKEALLKCLTLRDVRELAHFELPTFSNPTLVGEQLARKIELPPGSLPGDLYAASLVVQLLLFFATIHFGAFAREAISSATFPAQGTLFGAFSRGWWSVLVLFLALWSPLLASLGVAVASRRWSLAACSALIGCAVLFAHLALQRKSYFGACDPRPILRRWWPKKRAGGPDSSHQ